MGCIYGIVKYYLFLTNLLYTLVGAAVIGIGIWLRFSIQDFIGETGYEELSHIVVYIFIAFGCIIFLISFCGCCGSISEVRCLLITYSIVMFLMGTAKIVIAIILFSKSEYWRNSTETFVNDAFKDRAHNSNFHALEAYLECCGTIGPVSYIDSTSSYLPPTCCPDTLDSIKVIANQDPDLPISIDDIASCTVANAFPVGCSVTVGNFVTDLITTVGNVLIWIGVYELANMLAAIYLCYKVFKNLRKAKKPQEQMVVTTSTVTMTSNLTR